MSTTVSDAATHATARPPAEGGAWADRARRAMQGRATPADHDRSGQLPEGLYRQLVSEGLTSALVPREHRGGGASHAEMGAALREVGRIDPAVAVTLSMHSHLVAAQVWRHHRGMDATAVFSKVANGAILVSTGASDWVGPSGRAERVDGGYRVWGAKAPASGCEVGDVLVTSIRWEESPDGPRVLHCSLPFDADGVRIEQTWDTLGLRATGSHTVVLDDVFVPDSAVALVRQADVWHPVWNTVLGAAMPLIMAAYVGVADAAVAVAGQTLRDRREAHVLTLLGEMTNAHTTAVDVVEAMFASSQDLRFEGTDEHASRTLARKTVAADALVTTVRLAIEAVGGTGYSRSCELERLYRDVHGCLFHPLPRAKQLRFTGRVAQGLPPTG